VPFDLKLCIFIKKLLLYYYDITFFKKDYCRFMLVRDEALCLLFLLGISASTVKLPGRKAVCLKLRNLLEFCCSYIRKRFFCLFA